MLLKDYPPHPALRDLVQCYRIVHFSFEEADSLSFKAYPPKPELCLHFILKGDLQFAISDQEIIPFPFSMAMIGQQTSVMPRYTKGNFLNFQVVFHSSSLFRLTGIPAPDLANQIVNAELIFPGIKCFFEELLYADNYAGMLTIGDRFVRSLLSQRKMEMDPVETAIKWMIKKDGLVSLDWLAKEACLCTRQFKRNFHERMGVNPKTYARLLHFIRAYNTRNANPGWDWLKVAVDADYYDYQHLVRDYRTFTGTTPTSFHLLEQESPECKLGLADAVYKERFKPVSFF
ncbi:MAG: AraC family transcriptional regulator [Flavihumibacter sp.]|nr:AraC family transcriptional regulator [Flavihumibacter sp.]